MKKDFSKSLTFRLSVEQFDEFKAYTDRLGRDMSKQIRRLMEKWVHEVKKVENSKRSQHSQKKGECHDSSN